MCIEVVIPNVFLTGDEESVGACNFLAKGLGVVRRYEERLVLEAVFFEKLLVFDLELCDAYRFLAGKVLAELCDERFESPGDSDSINEDTIVSRLPLV